MINEKALLKLVNIKKDYILANNEPVHALKGITLNFRKNEFVSILGPSGCGKTTLLNIIGGLDKYTDGDLIIANKSTKKYKDKDWDIYRNHRIGFIFQSYNLIMHQTILENVELALTISGINKKERVIKAKEALDKVGLKDMYNKKPNQLSGGQCQRVAIARALVNEPDILLADEPTGALDSVTSKQIMDLISEISKEKLVIMVTHNPELASIYSTRIIKLLDGNVVSDSNVLNDSNEDVSFTKSNEKAKMSFPTAFKLSARNLLTKWKRTLLVCIAGSIGIVGVSTVLSVSAGVHQYIDSMQDDMLSGNPITISQTGYDLNAMMNQSSPMDKVDIAIKNGYVNVNSMIKYLLDQSKSMDSFKISNDITKDYIDFVLNMDKDSYAAMTLDYGISLDNNVYTTWNYNNTSETKRMSVSAITKMYTSVLEKTSFNKYATYIEQLNSGFAQAPNNNDYILSQYDILSGNVAKNEDEIMIVVSKNTRLTDVLLAQLGYYTQEEFINLVNNISKDENVYDHLDDNKLQFTYDELINKEFVFYPNNVVFNKNGGITKELSPFTYNAYVDESFTDGIKLKVAGILRPKDDISYGCLDVGFYYTEALSKRIIKENINSDIINYYKENNKTLLSNCFLNIKRAPIDNDQYEIDKWKNYGFFNYNVKLNDYKITNNMLIANIEIINILKGSITYFFNKEGKLIIDSSFIIDERIDYLPRLGYLFNVNKKYKDFSYIGYGKDESYVDKHHLDMFNIYNDKISKNIEYIKPQETKSHLANYLIIKGKENKLIFNGMNSFSYLPYTIEELINKKHNYELKENSKNILCLDYKMSGIGSYSCGPELNNIYKLTDKNIRFTLEIKGEAYANS